jgi:hypothetical protein
MRHYAILGNGGSDLFVLWPLSKGGHRIRGAVWTSSPWPQPAGPPAVSEENKTEQHGVAFVSVHAASFFLT